MNYSRCALIFLALVLFCSMPAMGVTTYLSAGPQMSAAITGTNEFSPGQDAVISVIVQNRGVNTIKTSWAGGSDPAAAVKRPDLSKEYYAWQGSGTIERDDIPTTAKMVTVGLDAGTAPIIVKSDPQNIGDMASQQVKTVKITTKITSDATAGEYTLPLTIGYLYLAASSQEAADVLQSDYRQANETVPLIIKIKPEVRIRVLEVVPENLSVGTGGYLNLTIRNDGFGDGKKATVKLLRNGNSPVIPTDSSVYVGDFPRNGTVTCRYKVAISADAEEQSYPVDVAVSYENHDGDMVTSASDTVGIPVRGKITFAVVSDPVSVTPGSDAVITVQYRNTGSVPAYNGQARLSVVDPFTSSDNSAFLGDMKPGEEATATYRVTTDSGAEAQEYMLDTEIRYRDELDNSQISDTFKLRVRVAPSSPLSGIVALLPVLVLAVIAAGAGYYLLVMRKKK
ncbi:MAG: NEW3 domain-containing protein [Methanoregula sp.]|nr:NEW3 domain-containing protein [Methanoregula sp.]